MADYRRSEIVSGLFICLAIVVFCLFAFKVGGFDLGGLFKGPVLACKTYFTDVKTLAPGAVVKVGGQPVGKVTMVRMVERALTQEQVDQLRELSEDKVSRGLRAGMLRQLIEIEFEVHAPDLKLHEETARVTLNQGSLLAPHFLDLDPGEWTAEEEPMTIFEADLKEDLVIASKESTGIDELVAIMKPVVREMNLTLSTINQRVLTPRNTQAVTDALDHVVHAVEESRRLLARIEAIFSRIDRDFLSAENAVSLEELLGSLKTAAEDTRELAEELSGLFDRRRDPRLQETLDSLADGTRGLRGRLDAVQEGVEGLLVSATAVLQDNRPEVAEALRRLRRASWQAEMALRKIRGNPSVLFFGDSEQSFEEGAFDETDIRYSGRVRPYGQRQEAGASHDE